MVDLNIKRRSKMSRSRRYKYDQKLFQHKNVLLNNIEYNTIVPTRNKFHIYSGKLLSPNSTPPLKRF